MKTLPVGVYQIYGDRIADMRRQGNTLQEIGETIGVSRERVRQILLQHYGKVETSLLTEEKVTKVIGCNPSQLPALRKKGVTNPKHTIRLWLYDRNEIEKAMLALQRNCEHCGKPLPLKKAGKYCPECSKESQRYNYPFMNDQQKKKFHEQVRNWQKENPERARELQRRAEKKYGEKQKKIKAEIALKES